MRLPVLKAGALIVNDFWWGLSLRAGFLQTDSGTLHRTLSEKESVRYIEDVFCDYKKYGGLDKFHGTVAEVGPGDNAGVALLMRHDGCQHVDLIDRYFSRRDPDQQQRIYEALSTKYQLDWVKTGARWNERELRGIDLKGGQSAEEYFRDCARIRGTVYDVIVSRAVLEHLYDPLGAVESMVSCLKPGGKLIHKIDLRDHGMFTPEHHELTFLRFSSRVYRHMTQHSGRPNRILWYRYRELLDRLSKDDGIEYKVFITRLVGVGDIHPHQVYDGVPTELWCRTLEAVERGRKSFAREFAEVSGHDLGVAGVFLAVTKR